jgi:hypothetical protein
MAHRISRCIDNDVNKSIERSLSTGGTDALLVAFFMCTKDSANQTDEDKLVTLMNEHAKRTINPPYDAKSYQAMAAKYIK